MGKLGKLASAIAHVIGDALRGLLEHDAVTSASTIAFSLLFALFPFLILIVMATTGVLGAEHAMALERDLLDALPEHIAKTVGPELETVLATRASSGIFTLGIAAILFSVSGLVETVRYALNRAYRLNETRSFVLRRVTGLLFVVGVTATLIAIAALGVVLPLAMRFLTRLAPDIAAIVVIYDAARPLLSMVLLAVLVTALHVFLPPHRLRFFAVLPGVAVTLVLFWLISAVFFFYLERFSTFSAIYAGLAGVIAVMLFFEFCALALIVGAEFNRAIADRRAGDGLSPAGSAR
jgi:membrane protein